jgi:RimJ/RimL family protein N-acetyltransferase
MPEGWPGPEIGWALVRDVWGKGYATEGAATATDWAFDNLGWTEVIHSIDPANVPSQQVARRLGSRNLRPGRLPPPFDGAVIDIWGQSVQEWRARHRGE